MKSTRYAKAGLLVVFFSFVVLAIIAPGCEDDTEEPLVTVDAGIEDGATGCSYDSSVWQLYDFDGQVFDVDGGVLPNMFDVWGADKTAIWAVGSDGTILFYNGESWTQQETPTDTQLTAIWGATATNVWACGYGGVVLHFDGTQWRDVSPPTELFLEDVDAGVPTGDAEIAVRRNLWGIWMRGDDTTTTALYVVGDRGTILSYENELWSRPSSSAEEDLSAVWGANANAVFAVGDFGTILQGSASAGFSKQQTGTSNALRGVWGRNGSDVYAVGVGGTVLRFDGGQWVALEGAPQQVLRDIWGSPDDWAVGYIVGWDGALLRFRRSGQQATYETAGCNIPSRRFEGIWGTLVDGSVPDATPLEDGGVPDLSVPWFPKFWVVGVSGTVLTGPTEPEVQRAE